MTRTKVHVRWMINRDMPEVLAIDNEIYTQPWSEEDFKTCLRARNCIGMVAETEVKVVGYMIHVFDKGRFTLMRITVDPAYHRTGVGSQLLDKLKGKLTTNLRPKIRSEVPESNLRIQLFLKSQGFKATAILEEDMTLYRFVYKMEAA